MCFVSFICKFSNKVVSKLVFDAIYSHIAYQIEDLDERNVTPQISSQSDTRHAHNCHLKFSVLKLSRLMELNQAEPNWTKPSWVESNRIKSNRANSSWTNPDQTKTTKSALTVDGRWPLTERWPLTNIDCWLKVDSSHS